MTIQSRPSPMDPPCPVPTLYYTAWEWVHGGGICMTLCLSPAGGHQCQKAQREIKNILIFSSMALYTHSALRIKTHAATSWQYTWHPPSGCLVVGQLNSHVTSIMLPCGWPFQLSHEPALYRTDLGVADLMLEHSWLASFLTHESWHSELTSALYTHGKNHPWCSSLICVVVEIADFSHDVHHWSWLWSKWLTSSMVFITDLCCSTNGWLIPWCSSLISVVVQMADLYYDAHHWSLLWHNGWLLPWCSSLISVVVQMTDFFHGVHHWSLL